MTTVFVLRNQDHLYFDKRGEWTDGSDSSSLYRTPYKDEALNQKLELTVRHPDLRITLLSFQLDDKDRLRLPPQPECQPQATAHGAVAGEPAPLPQDAAGEPA